MGTLPRARRFAVDDINGLARAFERAAEDAELAFAADDLALLARLRSCADDAAAAGDAVELDLEPDDLQLLAWVRVGEEGPLG